MRTDSVRSRPRRSTSAASTWRRRTAQKALPEQPNEFKSKKQNVQDAHEAIRPTRMDLPPDEVRAYLTDERFKLYKLIWDRFVACQMCRRSTTRPASRSRRRSTSRSYGLRASGSVLEGAGLARACTARATRVDARGRRGPEPPRTRTAARCRRSTRARRSRWSTRRDRARAKHTEPPPYFNEASLVKKLEEEGIGRPSTYAEILSKVQARDYVQEGQQQAGADATSASW